MLMLAIMPGGQDKESTKRTPLHLACMNGSVQAVEFLCSLGPRFPPLSLSLL
jgi:hypothetical protein